MAAAERLARLVTAGTLGLITLMLVLLFGGRALAGPPRETPSVPVPGSEPERLRLSWRPASVVWPLASLTDSPLAARFAEREAMLAGVEPSTSVRGPVEIDRTRALGVWIAALETVRVRQLDGPTPPRFIRAVDANTGVVEPGRAVPCSGRGRCWELTQPPSTGALWSIEADDPARILVERVEPRSARYVAVELELELLEWIASNEPDASMPTLLEPAPMIAAELRLDAALGRELVRIGGSKRRLATAVAAWRMLSAIALVDRERPAVRPYFGRARAVRLADTRSISAPDRRAYQLAERPRRWRVTSRGPGQLRIAARTWAPIGGALESAELRVHAGGRMIARIPLSPRQARRAVDPDTAIPRFEPLFTDAGEPIGELAMATIVLAPERHGELEIELVGGPAVISIDAFARIEATAAAVRGWTPRKRALAAARALRRSDSASRPWLTLLLAGQTHAVLELDADDDRFDALGRTSPLLATACLAIAAEANPLDQARLTRSIERVRPWLAALDRDSSVDPSVRGLLRARWLELIARHDRPELAARLTEHQAAVAELPIAGLQTLAELLGPTHAAVRSPALALLELARRRAPEDESLRAQTIRAWTEASRWSRRRPLPAEWVSDRPGPAKFGPAGQWLVARDAVPADPIELADAWLRLDPGRATPIVATVGDDPRGDPDRRMRLIDVFVATPPGTRAPARIRVDDHRWWSPQLDFVQRHRIAVGPGEHTLAVDAPAETIVWTEAALVDADARTPERLGRREQLWPLAGSVWKLPGPATPGYVRLELRWLASHPAEPVRIRVIEDGRDHARVVLFDPRTAAASRDPNAAPRVVLDAAALPILGSPAASERHDVVLEIAATTTELRFEVEGNLPVAGGLSLRRGPQTSDFAVLVGDQPPPTPRIEPFALDHDALVAELARASRRLLTEPLDLQTRASRAALLLQIGETGHARADLVRLAAISDNPRLSLARRERARALLDELAQRFEALTDPREIVVAERERVATPILVEPALAAVIADDRSALEPWLDRFAALRETDLEPALAELDAVLREAPDDPLGLGPLARAHLLGRDPSRSREAGRAWARLYGQLPGQSGRAREPIAVALASVGPLLDHLDDPSSDARDAGLAYGLAREIEPVFGHASVRRLAFVAAERSEWIRLDHSEDNAGFERLELPVAELKPSPTAEIRDALLAAPWLTNEAESLGPGRSGVLAWDVTPGTATVELWCRAVRPDLAPRRASEADRPTELGSAHVLLRLHDPDRASVIERELEVHDAVLGSVELPISRSGRHQLEVALADDPIWRCSWRASTATGPVEPRRRARWWTANSKHGVEVIVLGPASLELELRGIESTRSHPTHAIATLEPLDQGPTNTAALELSETLEPTVLTERRRRFAVTDATTHTLLLTEPGPHRIRVTTDPQTGGRVLVRARLRRERGDAAPPAQVSIREFLPAPPSPTDTFIPIPYGPARPLLAGDPVPPIRNRVGTLGLVARTGFDQIGDADDLDPRLGARASIAWRRALVDDVLWLAVAAESLVRVQSSPTFGGSIHLAAILPVVGIRLGSSIELLAEPFDGRAETSLRALGFVDRPIWLGPWAQLRPGLTAGLRWQSLTPERLATTNTNLEPHPLIYQLYLHDHPVLLRPELELRIYPLQDVAIWAEAQLVPNSDLRSLDHTNVELGFAGIARRPRPWVPLWAASYQASPRFVDADRSTPFVRHRVTTELGVAVWARDAARLALGVTHQLFLSSYGATLATGSAPIRNVIELWIRVDASLGRRLRDHGPHEIWFREPWAPRAWGDDEHQAQSTQAPNRR